MKKFIKGYFTRIIFKSDNNYIIGLMRVQDTNDDEMIEYYTNLVKELIALLNLLPLVVRLSLVN